MERPRLHETLLWIIVEHAVAAGVGLGLLVWLILGVGGSPRWNFVDIIVTALSGVK